MGRVGAAGDNAAMESFFSLLQKNVLNRRTWTTREVARRPKTAKLVTNPRLHGYVQERLSGQIRRPDGTPIIGPATGPWTGRNKPHRKDREELRIAIVTWIERA